MERKIGEIFEYNGEWYQCVKNKGITCTDCPFFDDTLMPDGKIVGAKCDNMIVGSCAAYFRKDGVNVYFKKLEKVGEPFTCNYYGDSKLIMMQEYKAYDNRIISTNGIRMYVTDEKHKRVAIEIKQNQENMEKKLNLKPFSLEAAKAGKPVCTRDGRKARIICFDKRGKYPIVVLVTEGEEELVFNYNNDGYFNGEDVVSDYDLMMLPEKREGWVNVIKNHDDYYYCNGVFDTEEYARNNEANYPNLVVSTVKIEWED